MSLVDMIIGKDRLREQRDTTISAIEEKYDPSVIQPQLDFAEDLAREGIEDEADLSRRNFLVNSFAGEEPARLTGGNQATALASANATSEAQMGALSELERDLSRQDIEAKRQGRSALAKGRSQQRTILGERDSQIDQAETMFNAEVDRRKRGLVSSIVGTAGAIATTPFGGGGSLLSRGLGKAFGGANAIAEGANAVTEAGDFLGMMDGIKAIPEGANAVSNGVNAVSKAGDFLGMMDGINAIPERPTSANVQPNGQDVNELLQNADDQLMGSGVLTPENFDQRLDTPEQVDPFGDIDGEQVLAEFKADVAKENTPMVQRDTGYFTPDENGNLPFWSTKDGKAVDFFDLPLFERGREIRPTGRKKRGNDAFFEKDENARLLEQERLLEQTAEGGGYSSAYAGPITSRNPIPEQVDPFGDIDGEQVLAEFKADVAQRGSNDVGVEDMVDFVGGFEGFKTDAYLDTKGNSTIGYGTTRYPDGTPVEMGDTITKEKALEFKTQHLEQSIKDAKDLVGNYDELPRDAKKILIDMIYNMGKDGVRDFRGFREALEEGDFEKASNHLMYQTGSPNGPITPYAIDTGDRAKAHIDTLKQLDQR